MDQVTKKQKKIKQKEDWTPLGILYLPSDDSKCEGCKHHRIRFYCELQYCKPKYE
mgnify:FL=1